MPWRTTHLKRRPFLRRLADRSTKFLLRLEQSVHAGQTLLTVTSPTIPRPVLPTSKPAMPLPFPTNFYKRAQDLYAHGAISEADLQQAESNRTQAHADMESSADALRALGMKDPEALVKNPVRSTAEIPIPAPVAGEIVERLVGPGQLLQGGATQCFTISNTSTVWVLVNIYQSDLPFVHLGDFVEINTDAYPELFHGKISYIAPALDPNTRTLQARIVTQNPGKKLKKDLYVTALVKAGSIPDAITVPDAAILRDTENQPFVYVQTNANQFARRVVTLGEQQQNTHSDYQWPERGGTRRRRRQPVPAIQEFASTLRRALQRHHHDSSHRPIRSSTALPGRSCSRS